MTEEKKPEDVTTQTTATVANTPESNAGSQSTSEPYLNIFRVREQRDTGAFYDPSADVRKVIPVMLGIAREILLGTMEHDDPKEHYAKDVLNTIDDITKLYQIRLVEEDRPIADVMATFIGYWCQIDKDIRAKFSELFLLSALVVYGMFARREAIADKEVNRLPLKAGAPVLSAALALVTSDTREKVFHELHKVDPGLWNALAASVPDDAIKVHLVDKDTGNVALGDIQELAQGLIHVKNGRQDWDTVSHLLDNESAGLPNETTEDKLLQLALSRAFPRYGEATK